MAVQRRAPVQSAVNTTSLADLLERILDKGVVIAGDIRISLVNVELLTIQLRLVICSVDKAEEMGMDWWVNNPAFQRQPARQSQVEDSLDKIVTRMEKLEKSYSKLDPKETFKGTSD